MDAAEALIDRYGDAVWRTAFRWLGHHDDAADCYQQTFLEFFRRGGGVDHPRALLVRIATARSLDRLRTRYRCPEPLNIDGPAAQAALASVPPVESDRLLHRELLGELRRALATLPADQAEAFWLRHVEEMSVAEVAEAIDVSESNVRVLTHRAARAVRPALSRRLSHPAS